MTHFHLNEWDCDLAKKGLIAIVRAKKMMGDSFKTELEQLAEIDVGASIQLQKEQEEAASSETPSAT
jgi:hypothetical protein